VSERRNRDTEFDALLRRALASGTSGRAAPTSACLDAETLAAWAEGRLSGRAWQMAESHAADCPRCQSLLGAMARAEPGLSQGAAHSAPRLWLKWAMPLAAAAAVLLVVWINRPGPIDVPSSESARRAQDLPDSKAAASTDAKAATQLAARLDEAPAQPSEQRQADRQRAKEAPTAAASPKLETDRLNLSKNLAAPPSAPAAAAPAAPTAAKKDVDRFERAAALRDTKRGAIINSADGKTAWRVRGATVEHSTDAGATWRAAPTGMDLDLTGGSAPAATVCWLIGPRGVVLLSIDGVTWRRLPFPDVTDLSAIQATDARNATVTTADGRTFATTDGGATWVRKEGV
jgi:hypothetical protein